MTPRNRATRFRCGRRTLALPLKGRRIGMRTYRRSDGTEVARIINDPVIARGTLGIPYPYAPKDFHRFLDLLAPMYRKGTFLPLVIVDRVTDTPLGGMGLHAIHPGESAEVGYWMGTPHRRQGYAGEALQLLLRASFGPLGLHRIEARVFPDNRASLGLLRAAGFTVEGRVREAHRKNGKWRDDLLLSRLSTDPPVGARRA